MTRITVNVQRRGKGHTEMKLLTLIAICETCFDAAHRITGIVTGIEHSISISMRDETVQQIAVWWQGRFTAGPIVCQNDRVMCPPLPYVKRF